MSRDDAFEFLCKTPPFSLLPQTALRSIAQEISMASYRRGDVIHHQAGPAPDHLSIIRSGAVKVSIRTNEGEEVLIDFRSAGDYFGMRSFVYGDIARDTVVAAEETSCFLINKETILELLKTNAAFSEFCLRSWVKRLVEMVYKEIRDRTLMYGGGDKLLFTTVLNDLAADRVIAASEDISIKDAAGIMAAHKISSLLLLDPDGLPSGMITDRDLRNKVVAKGRDTAGRVGDIMSVTIIKSEAGDYCFEALLKMMRYNIHHLLVVDKGEMKGVVTNHDFMMLQGTSPLAVAKEIEEQDTIDGLVPVSGKIGKIITILVKEGAKASNITRLITEVNDRLLKKILDIAESRLGPPPLSYCWIVFGSEGRKEQTFKTDQDNAIIYEDQEDRGEEAGRYFSELAALMKDALIRCGFPPCSAGYMASNPLWRQQLRTWKKYFSGWINSPTPDAVLRSLIFFDFRPVHGDFLLAEKLRAFLGHEIKNKHLFLAHMAAVVVKNRPPLDFFGNIRVSKKGSSRGKFDIKINGLCPIIDAARFSALEMNLYHTSTRERLIELKDSGSTVREFSDELELAFEFLMSLRLRHQFSQLQEGVDPDNFIDPGRLANIERSMLKETFRLIRAVQRRTMQRYSAWMPG